MQFILSNVLIQSTSFKISRSQNFLLFPPLLHKARQLHCFSPTAVSPCSAEVSSIIFYLYSYLNQLAAGNCFQLKEVYWHPELSLLVSIYLHKEIQIVYSDVCNLTSFSCSFNIVPASPNLLHLVS